VSYRTIREKVKTFALSHKFTYQLVRIKRKFLYSRDSILYTLLRYGRILPIRYNIVEDRKLVYLVNCKAACSTIKASLYHLDVPDDHSVHWIAPDTFGPDERQYKDYFKFTFVRNPYDRLVSCYENLPQKHKELHKYYLFGYLERDKGFSNFCKKVCRIPFCLADMHFESQYYLLSDKQGNCRADYIGKYENLAEEYEWIREKYGLAPLRHLNPSGKGNWMDYYTRKTAQLVYKKYRKDFETLGYEGAYQELMEYLDRKEVEIAKKK